MKFVLSDLAALAFIGIVAVAPAAQASDANTTVAHRQQVMNAAGAMMGSLACAAKNECQLDGKAVTGLAKGVSLMARLSIPAFKDKADGTTIKHTAKADIWTDWTKFEGGLKAMDEAAAKMATLAHDGKTADALAGLADLGKTCKGCHEAFRSK